MHPLEREVFQECGAPSPATRVEYRTEDGWTAPIFVEPACPGGSGEPVVLLHTLGLGPDAFRYGRRARWVDPWTRAGFRVYMPTWRGDREAVPPAAGQAPCFDAAVSFDMPAMIEAVLADSGARRCLVVGHGIGGQLALGHIARCGDEQVFGVAVLSAPVQFERPSSTVTRGMAMAGRLAGAARAPARKLARAAAALTDPTGDARGPRLRGALLHAVEDVPVGLLHDLASWLREGALVDRSGVLDYTAALRAARAPLWVTAGAGDTWCPPEHVLPVRGLWGGRSVTTGWMPDDHGHIDAVVHPAAARQIVEPIVRWASAFRQRAWGAAPEDMPSL